MTRSSFAVAAILAASLGSTFGSAAPAFAQQDKDRKPLSSVSKAVPNFTGYWTKPDFRSVPPYIAIDGVIGSRGGEEKVIGGLDSPILKPFIAQMLIEKAFYRFRAQDNLSPNPHSTCWPDGVPAALGLARQHILQTPTEINIIYHTDNQPRYIYLNRPHATPMKRSWFGDSVGHFEGDTLVVDTVGFIDGRIEASIDRYGTPVTGDLHVVERYKKVDNGQKMEITITVEDPNLFKGPWSQTIAYTNHAERHTEENRCSEENLIHPKLIPVATIPDF